ncbi:hypothetical protein GmHk_03G006696 [Glycine max]|nr:hypothetical protein GmHk_03G006696 [Glycine max]
MAICFHWDVLQLSYFFLDLLDLDEEAGMIQKSANQTDQNENAEEQGNAESTNQTLMPANSRLVRLPPRQWSDRSSRIKVTAKQKKVRIFLKFEFSHSPSLCFWICMKN